MQQEIAKIIKIGSRNERKKRIEKSGIEKRNAFSLPNQFFAVDYYKPPMESYLLYGKV